MNANHFYAARFRENAQIVGVQDAAYALKHEGVPLPVALAIVRDALRGVPLRSSWNYAGHEVTHRDWVPAK